MFDLAREQNALDEVESNASTLRQMIAESDDLRRLMDSPVFKAEDQIRALDAVMASHGVGGLVANFAKLTAKNRRLFALGDMLKAFAGLMAKHRGETLAVVTSASPLNDEQLETLRQVLSEKTGGTMKLETVVDPSLIGGLIVRLGSQMIDTSVRTRLLGLRQAMKEAA
ncbi:F0F1 ATP synthase subunit delta [Stappia sp. 22II-S9-Z10]|nr:F0F1 ATP synthase subunit delta [Stappia sp. 22II-S9-Z10]